MGAIEFFGQHGDTITILVLLGGIAWKASARITQLEAGIKILQTQVDSLQRELTEAKESASDNFRTAFDRLDDMRKGSG